MKQTVHVTLCAAAYQELHENTKVEVEPDNVDEIIAVDPSLGIGRSVIFLLDGNMMNVMESVEELTERGIGSC